MTRRELASVLALTMLRRVAAQPRYVDGVFVHDGERPIELLAYAERAASGLLRLAAASFDDVPEVVRIYRVLCSQPTWKPAMVWASTMEIFKDERAERRQLRFGTRQLNVYAVELAVPDVESADRVAALARRVGATPDNPLLALVTMRSDGLVRDYPIQLSTRP